MVVQNIHFAVQPRVSVLRVFSGGVYPLNRGLIVTLKCWLTVWREELCHQQGETRLMISAGMRVSRRPFYTRSH